MTDKDFGVNLTFLPIVNAPDYAGYVRAIVASGVTVVETAGNNAAEWLPTLKAAGITVTHKCIAVRHALKAEAISCDVASVDGFECAGHPGEDDVPNFMLLPAAANVLGIPIIASGGMVDGRSVMAALALGAEGINMGTRFVATTDAPVRDRVKQAIVGATELDTRIIMRPLRDTERVLRYAAVDRVLEVERVKGPAVTFDVLRGCTARSRRTGTSTGAPGRVAWRRA